jgi:hypothetical protein
MPNCSVMNNFATASSPSWLACFFASSACWAAPRCASTIARKDSRRVSSVVPVLGVCGVLSSTAGTGAGRCKTGVVIALAGADGFAEAGGDINLIA